MADILQFPASDPSRIIAHRAEAMSRAILHPQAERLQRELDQWRHALDQLDRYLSSDPSGATLLQESAIIRRLISAAASRLEAIFEADR